MNNLKTFTNTLIINHNDIMCFTLLCNNEEICKYWSMHNESKIDFLNRIDSELKSIMKLK